MSDLDKLQIQITASTTDASRKIDELIGNLGRLNAALNNYSGDSSYLKGLASLSSGLASVSSAIQSMDASKIKTIATALGELGTKGASISKLNFAGNLMQMGSSMQQVSERTKKVVDEISNAYGIKSKKGIEELVSSVDRFYGAVGNDSALKGAANDVEEVIKQFMKLKKVEDSAYESLRADVSHTKFAMPQGASAEFKGLYKQMRGTFGLKNTKNSGTSIESVLSELNDRHGKNYDTMNAYNGLNQLYQDLQKGAQAQAKYDKEQRASLHTSEAWVNILDKMYASLNQVNAAQEKIDPKAMLDVDLDMFDEFGLPLDNVAQTTQVIEEVKESAKELVEVGQPFEGLINGLYSLADINITADQFSGVKTLSESLGKLSGSYAEKASALLPQIASGLSMMSNISLPDNTDQLIQLGTAIGKFGGAAATRAQGLPFVVDGLRQLQDIHFENAENVAAFASSISKFGYAKVETAITNMPQLASSFYQLSATLAKAPQVSTRTLQLAQAMAQLATSSRNVGQATQQSSAGVKSFRSSLASLFPTVNKAQKHTFSLAQAFGKLYASYFLLIRGIRKLGDSINYSSQLTEVQNVVNTTFGNATKDVEEFANSAMYSFGLSELSAKQFASRFQAMGSAMGITSKQVGDANDFIAQKIEGNKRAYSDLGSSMSDLSINLTKLTSDFASFYNMDFEDVADDMSAIFTGQTRPLRRYGLDLTNATLQEWAMKNGLDSNIKAMSQAEKTMLRYQYVMANSGHIMGDFAKTANTWANVIKTIGQQFQKLGQMIGGGLINTFKPFLIGFRDFLNTFIGLTEKAMNAVGKLMGWQVEIEEVGVTLTDDAEGYADALDDAAGSAKKLNSQLRGIDELNNLTSSGKGGSGSASGGGAGLLGDMNKGLGGDIKFKNYESEIGSWKELGERIAENIKKGLDKIKWEKIFSKASKFGKNLANFLNGSINPETFYSVGKTVANAIGVAIEASYSFLSNFDFKNLGKSIANAVNGFFENFKWKKLAKSINKWVQGLKDTITTAIKNIKWGEVLSGIFSFASTLDFDVYALLGLMNIDKAPRLIKATETAFTGLKTALGKVSDKSINVVKAFDDMYSLTGSKSKGLNAGISELNKNMSGVAKSFIGLGSAVAEFGLIDTGVKNLMTDSDKLAESLAEMIGGVVAGAAGLTLVLGFPGGIIAAGLIGIAGAVTGVVKAMDEISTENLSQSIKEAFTVEGGEPLDQYIARLSDYISRFGDSFALISDRSNNLDVAKKNIKETVAEIKEIEIQLDAGVEATEEDVEKLGQLYERLRQSIEENISAASSVIYSALGEDSPIVHYYELTEDYVNEAIMLNDEFKNETQATMNELDRIMSEYEPGTKEYEEAAAAYKQLANGLTDYQEALLAYQGVLSGKTLDWSAYYNAADGSLNVDLLLEDLNSLKEKQQEVEDALLQSIDQLSDAASNNQLSGLFTDLSVGLEDAIKREREETGKELQALTDQLQVQGIDAINQIVSDAQADWEEMNWFEQLLYGFDEGDYIKGQVDKYKRNYIDPLSEEIESDLSALGIEGAGWSKDMASQIIDGMFITEDEVPTQLATNWEDVIKKAVEKVDVESVGSDVAKGVSTGMEKVTASNYKPSSDIVADNLESALRTSVDAHSPARKFYPVGEDITYGVLEGVNKVDFNKKMTDWWNNNVKPWFSTERWKEIGITAEKGLTPVITNMNADLSNNFSITWAGIYELIKQSVKDIQGLMNFEWSLPNIKVPHFSLEGEFDLETKKVPEVKVDYFANGGYPTPGSLFVAGEAGAEMLGSISGRTAVAGGAEITGIKDAIEQTSSEEVSLLRQQNALLQGILQKEFGISKGELFKSVRSSANEYYKMTGNPPF